MNEKSSDDSMNRVKCPMSLQDVDLFGPGAQIGPRAQVGLGPDGQRQIFLAKPNRSGAKPRLSGAKRSLSETKSVLFVASPSISGANPSLSVAKPSLSGANPSHLEKHPAVDSIPLSSQQDRIDTRI